MRGIPSLITDIRKKVFTEVARMAYNGDDYTKAEDLPYIIVPGDQPLHRESVFLERAIAGERVRLAMGLSVRSVQTRSLLTEGMDHAAIAQQYYEPPLINIIPYACHACPTNQYKVTENCQNCLAASCQQVCPRDAISFVNGKSFIDSSKCIKCGKCAQACSYNAIIHLERPCQAACGMDAIGADENGKAIITDSGNSGKVFFKLAKSFTVNGVTYRKLSHNYAVVYLTKLTGLPAPKVTVTPKNGGAPLTPSGPNTYTIKEFVNVELTKPSGWPLNATMAYAYNSSTSPQNAVPYTAPFEVRGEKTISVFTRVPKAGGGYDYERENYTFKVDSSVKKVLLVVRDATAYDSDGNELLNASTSGVNVSVGARIKVVPIVPSGKIFKNWSADGIYDTPSDKFKEELFFTMPDRSNNYNQLILNAEFADQSEAYITADTKVLLTMGKTQYNGNDVIMKGTVGDSVDLFINQSEGVDYHALRTISYQWWEGESAGTDDNALSTLESFDKSKTYTVKVTITANKGTKFADYAGVQFGTYGSFLKMKDVTRPYGGKTLTFTATPLREMNLTLPTLHEGDSLSKVQESFNTQLSPMGYEVEQLTWESGTPDVAGSAGTNYRINMLKLKLKQNRPLLDNKVIIDGTYCFHKSDSNGSLVVLDGSKKITVIVRPKGVSVSGTAVSWNDTNDALYYLYPSTMEDAAIRAQWKTGGTVTGYTYTGTGGAITATTVDGKSMKAQPFSFGTIPAGSYKLVIFKPGKYVPKIVPITVESTALNLGQLKLWLYGDVNYDGAIKAIDVTMARQYFKGNLSSLTDEQICAIDMNGDGSIKAIDITILRQYFKGNISTIPIA